MLAKGIIESELRIFDGLGDAVDLVLAIMHEYLRILHRHHIDLAIRQLMMEDRPFLEADADLH